MEERQKAPPPPRGGCGRLVACGCVVIIILALVGGILGWIHRGRIIAGVGRWGLNRAVEQSRLEPKEKEGLRAAADRIFTKMEKGELAKKDYERLADSFQEQPISKVLAAAVFKVKYLAPSGLSEEEKGRALLDLDRLIRGVVEGKVSNPELEPLRANFPMEKGWGGMPDLPDSIPDVNVRAIVAEARRIADAKGIPEEEYRVDLVQEANRWIDAALGEKN